LEIILRRYDFIRRYRLAEVIDQLKLEDLVTFYMEQLHPDGLKRKRLAIFIRGSKCEEKLVLPSGATMITSIIEFQRGRQLYPSDISSKI